jgi:hypothetical protein
LAFIREASGQALGTAADGAGDVEGSCGRLLTEERSVTERAGQALEAVDFRL